MCSYFHHLSFFLCELSVHFCIFFLFGFVFIFTEVDNMHRPNNSTWFIMKKQSTLAPQHPTSHVSLPRGGHFQLLAVSLAIYSHLSICQAYNDITWFLNFSVICWVPIVGGKVLMIEGKNLILLPQINKCNCHPLSPHVLNMIISWFFTLFFYINATQNRCVIY